MRLDEGGTDGEFQNNNRLLSYHRLSALRKNYFPRSIIQARLRSHPCWS